jgi:hypothetical protein
MELGMQIVGYYELGEEPMQFATTLLSFPHFAVYWRTIGTVRTHNPSRDTYCMFISSPSKSALYGGVLVIDKKYVRKPWYVYIHGKIQSEGC